MNIINEFFVSFILIKLYFKFKVCRKIKFPLLWKFYFSKWKFYFSADKIVKIEKMKFLNQVEVCFVIKTKNKILLKCFESIYKKEDLEKLKNWYENKL